MLMCGISNTIPDVYYFVRTPFILSPSSSRSLSLFHYNYITGNELKAGIW